MNLYIRHDTVSEVLVADRDTGYAVAIFLYQCGDDNKPKFPARKLAEQFIQEHSTRYALKSVKDGSTRLLSEFSCPIHVYEVTGECREFAADDFGHAFKRRRRARRGAGRRRISPRFMCK